MNIINLNNTDTEAFIRQFESVLTHDIIYYMKVSDSTIGFGAEENGTPVGVICGHPNDDVMELLHLYVAENYRRQGIASQLLDEFYWETLDNSNTEIINVEYGLLPLENMTALAETLKEQGYTFHENSPNIEVFELDVKDLIKQKEISNDVISFREMGVGYHEKIVKLLQEEVGISDTTLPDTTEMDISHVIIQDGKITAFFWLERFREDLLRVGALHSTGGNQMVSDVISASITKIQQRMTPESVIICDLYGGVGKKALLHMTDGKIRPCTQLVSAFSLL